MRREGAVALVQTVEGPGRRRFPLQVERLRRRGLHAKRHFKRLDPGFEQRIAADALRLLMVELLNQVQLLALGLWRELVIVQMRQDRLRVVAGVEMGALKDAGQKAIAPVGRPVHRQSRAENDVAGQVLVLAAQAVQQPGTVTGPH